MVTADEALHAVLEGPQGVLSGLPPDAIVVNTSTVSVEATEQAAERRGVYLPRAAATREAVNGAKALGHGDEDMAAVLKLLEAVSGTTVGDDGDEA